jgi:S-DNA-T family DNA segregation ATPase FtsK/SpoIIIE
MPKRVNQLKSNNLRNDKSKPKRKTTRTSLSKKPLFSFLKNEKFRKVSGFFLMLFSVYLLFAFISFMFSWWIDQDKLSSITFGQFSTKTGISNWTGFLGAYISKLLIHDGFGVSSFLLLLTLFVWGGKLLFRTDLLPVGKTIGHSLLLLIWLSVTFGMIFKNTSLAILGGVFGYQINLILIDLIGIPGILIVLIFILVSYLIISFSFPFHLFKSKKEKTIKNTEGIDTPTNKLKDDLYNTVEFSVSEDVDFEIADNILTESKEATSIDSKKEDGSIELDNTISEDSKKTENKEENIELTIEKTAEEKHNFSNGEVEHFGIDSEYDPTLDLAEYKLPPLSLLNDYGNEDINVQKEELETNKNRIVETLNHYSIKIDKIKATIGPAVTLYEIIPAPGIRISKIKNLEDDIALSLAAMGIRIIAPIPGKGTIGIEVPNQNPEIVSMKSILSSEKFRNTKMELPLALGKTISNESFIVDLTKMPHILMAGATGQGKSVGLNAILASLIYKKHPSQIKFVLVDPKKVELNLFSKIERHFLAKLPDSEEAIITDTRLVVRTVNSLCIEMDNRYELLKDAQVRNLKEYNAKFIARILNPNHGHRYLPYIVLVVDEFADLIMTAGKEIEGPITRLAQLSRAIGIHLIIATQRPSVNIITGTIKANFPARIAFRVISKIDSRTILDTGGADQLIGRGDMLLATGSDIIRLQCAFLDTPEVEKMTEFVGAQRAYPSALLLPEYADEQDTNGQTDFDPNERDELFEDAAKIIVQTQQGSTSLLQRKLKLGYNRAGRIIDQLESAGIVGPFEGSKAREVKVANEFALEQFLDDLNNKK